MCMLLLGFAGWFLTLRGRKFVALVDLFFSEIAGGVLWLCCYWPSYVYAIVRLTVTVYVAVFWCFDAWLATDVYGCSSDPVVVDHCWGRGAAARNLLGLRCCSLELYSFLAGAVAVCSILLLLEFCSKMMLLLFPSLELSSLFHMLLAPFAPFGAAFFRLQEVLSPFALFDMIWVFLFLVFVSDVAVGVFVVVCWCCS
ncbi:hypothetical protein U1Q18_035685 [Sarracenia purpurea var. burkii]